LYTGRGGKRSGETVEFETPHLGLMETEEAIILSWSWFFPFIPKEYYSSVMIVSGQPFRKVAFGGLAF